MGVGRARAAAARRRHRPVGRSRGRATSRAGASGSPDCRRTRPCCARSSRTTAGTTTRSARSRSASPRSSRSRPGKVDAVVAFWNVEGVPLRRQGVPTREFRVDEYGAPRYPELVLAVRGAVADDPERPRAHPARLESIRDGNRARAALAGRRRRPRSPTRRRATRRSTRAEYDAIRPALSAARHARPRARSRAGRSSTRASGSSSERAATVGDGVSTSTLAQRVAPYALRPTLSASPSTSPGATTRRLMNTPVGELRHGHLGLAARAGRDDRVRRPCPAS